MYFVGVIKQRFVHCTNGWWLVCLMTEKCSSDEKHFLPIPLRLFSIWFFSCLDNQHHFEGKKSFETCIRKESIYHKRWNFDDFSGGGFESILLSSCEGHHYPFKRFVSSCIFLFLNGRNTWINIVRFFSGKIFALTV